MEARLTDPGDQGEGPDHRDPAEHHRPAQRLPDAVPLGDSLYIGTGDAAIGSNPQNLSSLGGKVLRIRSDGYIWKSNPFYSRGGNARYVWTATGTATSRA